MTRVTKDMALPGQLWLYMAGLPLDLQGWKHPRALGASDAVEEPHQFLASATLRVLCLAVAIAMMPVAMALGKPPGACLTLMAASLGFFFLLSHERHFG